MSDLVGAVEVARRLNKPLPTIKRWALSGRLKHAARAPGKTGAYLFDSEEIARVAAELRAEQEKRAAELQAAADRAKAGIS